MKQLLFLLLFPCLAMAQYQGNANQKITLGEQTTADGLVWRGRLADTANLLTNKLDTSVYIVLDTGTRAMWYYRVSTTPKWTRLVDSLNNLQGQLSLTSKVTGTLPIANGGTGQTTATAALNALLPAQSQSTTIGATLKSNGTNSYWDNFSASDIVQDQSGNVYNTIAIGTQIWFKENLRTKKYRSGALIPVKTNTDTSTIVGQMYYYNNDSLTNYSVYGALYNWKATQNSDSLCPVGWHVPTDAEWTTLTTYLGGESVAGGKMKSVGTAYWNNPNTDATNESGFSALPGGWRNNEGSYVSMRVNAVFWSATEDYSSLAWFRGLFYDNGNVGRVSFNKSFGFSVRCLKN